jgi:hypothetical protein
VLPIFEIGWASIRADAGFADLYNFIHCLTAAVALFPGKVPYHESVSDVLRNLPVAFRARTQMQNLHASWCSGD